MIYENPRMRDSTCQMQVRRMRKPMLFWLIMQASIRLSLAAKTTPLLHRQEGEASIQPITWKCVQRIEADKAWKHFKTKGYPKQLYVRESRCSWKLSTVKGSRIRIAFGDIDLQADDPAHCSANYIEIIDETLKKSQARYCGQAIPGDIVSRGNKLRIDFQAQPGVNDDMKGFKIGFKATKADPGFYKIKSLDKKSQPATPSTKLITFQGGPNSNNRASDDEPDNNDTLTKVIVGISIPLVIVSLIGLFIWWRRRRKKKMSKSPHPEDQVQEDKQPNIQIRQENPAAYSDNKDKTTPNHDNNIFTVSKSVSKLQSHAHRQQEQKKEVTYINCQPPPLPLKNIHRPLKRRATPSTFLDDKMSVDSGLRRPFDQVSVDTQLSSQFSGPSTFIGLHRNHTNYQNRANSDRKRTLPGKREKPRATSNILNDIERGEWVMNCDSFPQDSGLTRSRSRACITFPISQGLRTSQIYLPEHQSKSLPLPPLPPKRQCTSSAPFELDGIRPERRLTSHRNFIPSNRSKSAATIKNFDDFPRTMSRSMSNLNDIDAIRPWNRCRSTSNLRPVETSPTKRDRLRSIGNKTRDYPQGVECSRQSTNNFGARTASRNSRGPLVQEHLPRHWAC
ncbi:unnamed protein product [Clavelina lepadiformis]|uniref:CUB domain-containing protein n=1 Tax=Clavelina lepadiformis TaxID=159417 RepID=A0ABP0GGP3_CLALP